MRCRSYIPRGCMVRCGDQVLAQAGNVISHCPDFWFQQTLRNGLHREVVMARAALERFELLNRVILPLSSQARVLHWNSSARCAVTCSARRYPAFLNAAAPNFLAKFNILWMLRKSGRYRLHSKIRSNILHILAGLRCQLWRNTHRAAAVVLMTGSAHLHRNRLAAFEIGVCPPALYAPSAYAPSNPCYQHTQCASGYPWLTHCNTPFKNALASIQRSFELFVAHKLTAFAHNSIMEALSRRENSRALTVWSQNVAGWMGF